MGDARRHITYAAIPGLAAACWMLWVSGVGSVRAQESRIAIEPRSPSHKTAAGGADRIATNIQVNSDLVLIPVMVTDRQDRPISGLAREHFRLWEDKVEQVITHFAAEDVPVSIGLVFDSSGSMMNKLKESRAAVSAFLKIANPEDEFFLVQFSDRVRLLEGFTSRSEDIQYRMTFIEPGGRTALLDAILLSMNQMKNAKHTRKAILVISDGGDNCSRYTTRDVMKSAREADVQIYSIGIMDSFSGRSRSTEDMVGAALLDEIAVQTGGRLFEVNDPNELPDIAGKIGMALRNQYVLGYVPAAERRDGKYHRVQVRIERPKGLPRLRASFRAGYFAPFN